VRFAAIKGTGVKLVHKNSDDALVPLNGGDELALSFQAEQLPAKPASFVLDFFHYVAGWDKDADFHVGHSPQTRLSDWADFCSFIVVPRKGDGCSWSG
jgi:hypothetical protein